MSDRMTAAEFRATQEKPKRAKYGNQKATLQGVLFDSAREARRWLVLQDMLRHTGADIAPPRVTGART
jgi:hypothetical protein